MIVLQFSLGSCATSLGNLPARCVPDTMDLYPYLTKDGLYGYADTQLQLLIPARYKSASMFTTTGYAVVEDEGHCYGVIDKKGTLVVPIKYKAIRLQVVGNHTTAWTERVYNNSLRFWEWRFWPGFWSPNDKRLFDTEVGRSHLRVTILENGQQLFSKRTSSGGIQRGYFDVLPLDETHFIGGGTLYGLDTKRYRVLARHIFGKVDGGLLLQRNRAHYRLLTWSGKPVDKSRFRYKDSLRYEIGGEKRTVNLIFKGVGGGTRRLADVFEDTQGEQYVFPDFNKSFPSHVTAQVHLDLETGTLLRKTSLISSIPGTDRFIFRWFDRVADTFDYRMLDTAGIWHQDVPENNTFSIVTGVGHIIWPAVSTIIPADSVGKGWELLSYSKVGKDNPLYEVTIRREQEERMGVWDVDGKKWAWNPVNASVRCLDPAKGYWTFRPEKEGKYGLYHLPTERELIPPKYHDMNASGMVSYYDDLQKYIRFYVDWDTQIEYWDH